MSSFIAGLLSRLDPRRSLAAAIGWMLISVSILGAYLASVWIGELARKRLEAQTGTLFMQYALQISNVLDNNLYDRLQWVRAMADLFAASTAQSAPGEQRALLERLQLSLPEISWAGFADTSGRIVAATGQQFEGESALDKAWFSEGSKQPWIGDVQKTVPNPNSNSNSNANAPRPPDTANEPARFIDLAGPVRDKNNQVVGVVGAYLAWSWAEKLEATLTEGLKSRRIVESLLVDRQGQVLLGPKALVGTIVNLPVPRTPGSIGQLVDHWPDGADYLAGYAVSDGVEGFQGLGWTVWVREPASSAFAEARALERRILWTLLILGILSALVSIVATTRLTRRLAAIARSADAIRHGQATTIAVPAGSDETARIGQSLDALVTGLQHERSALKDLNTELDARVAARTREVKRLSDENEYAAVVRERLRMARDLHDTLAHSMMAFLTETRLLRKLADTHPEKLKDELANAEQAAQDGLREARDAITALRFNAVRDTGLGAALRQLFKRFEERKGIAVSFQSARQADALADSRAETLYRIAEEALHNIERHARAGQVMAHASVGGAADSPTLHLSISDDGVGFDVHAPHPGHYGLRGMHEQAELIGAQLTITSAAGQGTTVTVGMPI